MWSGDNAPIAYSESVSRPTASPHNAPTLWRSYGGALAVCLCAVLLALPFGDTLDHTSLVLIFMLAVVVAGAWLGRGPALLAAGASVLLFNIVFVPPRYSLAVADERFLFTLVVMWVVGLVVGHLTASLRAQVQAAAASENRVRSLYDISRELGNALTMEQVVAIGRQFLREQLGADSLFWTRHPQPRRLSPDEAPGELDGQALELLKQPRQERAAQNWGHGHWLVPLQGPMAMQGVLALQRQDGQVWQTDEQRLVDACAALLGSALERIHYVDVARAHSVEIEGERLRNALLASISHDLRTPLASLAGLAESLQLTGPALSPEQAEIVRAMIAAAQRMGATANNLLDLARLQSSGVHLQREWVPIEEVIGTACATTAVALGNRQVEIDIPAHMPLFHIDPVLMERVLVNLLENAAKYTPSGSTVRFEASASDAQLCLSVSDDGPGLPGDTPADLLRKFERGTREGSTAGAGLGLALCEAIVRAHGARLEVGRSAQGGARLDIVFPKERAPAWPDPAPQSTD